MGNPVHRIKSYTGNPERFIPQGRGFVDWRFGQVAEYLGFERAQAYAESMRRWYNFESHYTDCLLNTTYEAFLEAEKELSHANHEI